MGAEDSWNTQRKLLGEFIRSQRRLAQLSLRELASRTAISNPYLSQIERGLHEPSIRVLKSIADALDLSADSLLAYSGIVPDRAETPTGDAALTTEAAIRNDPALTDDQKSAMLAVYRSYVEGRP